MVKSRDHESSAIETGAHQERLDPHGKELLVFASPADGEIGGASRHRTQIEVRIEARHDVAECGVADGGRARRAIDAASLDV